MKTRVEIHFYGIKHFENTCGSLNPEGCWEQFLNLCYLHAAKYYRRNI